MFSCLPEDLRDLGFCARFPDLPLLLPSSAARIPRRRSTTQEPRESGDRLFAQVSLPLPRDILPLGRCGLYHLLCEHTRNQVIHDMKGNVCSRVWACGSSSLMGELFGDFMTGTFHSKENFAGNISDKFFFPL